MLNRKMLLLNGTSLIFVFIVSPESVGDNKKSAYICFCFMHAKYRKAEAVRGYDIKSQITTGNHNQWFFIAAKN